MAKYELRMPKMGESIIEATILNWVKSVGDTIELDDTIVEIATDKVDSEVPSPVSGTLLEIRFQVDDVVPVGEIIAIIGTEGEESSDATAHSAPETPTAEKTVENNTPPSPVESPAEPLSAVVNLQDHPTLDIPANVSGKFYSPLVRSIASAEGISLEELNQIPGTGQNLRVTKSDVLNYLNHRSNGNHSKPVSTPTPSTSKPVESTTKIAPQPSAPTSTPSNYGGNVEVVEMDRMRKVIAKHMVESVHTSPHVTSFVEADVTHLVEWRNRVKKKFQEKYGEKITFTPIFLEAVIKAIKDFPDINISVDDTKIIYKKDINIGMAAALPSGNLIVPVIHQADHLNLLGLTKKVNDLANRARQNKLKPEEIQGGTYTVTNVGTFGNVLGTPIINQPQVAIMATGAIRKKPAVLETEEGDVIAIRHMMFLSHSYDHRVVDGYLGGSFVRRVADYLEQFDVNREI